MGHLAGRVEFDHQRREMPGIEFAIQDILTIEKEHAVLRIDTVAAETARDPHVREGLREGDIDLVARRDTLRPGISDTPQRRPTKTRRESHDCRRDRRASKACYELTSSHIRPLLSRHRDYRNAL